MLEPYDGEINEFYIDVFVKNPKVEEGSYVSYEIIIQTNNISFTASRSSIRRRYSEFVDLHKLLMKEVPAENLPSLPPKHPFKDHFNSTFIEKRREGLEEFLKKIVSQKIHLSSKSLHLFLQSTLSLTEIKEITQGKNIPIEACNKNICPRRSMNSSMSNTSSGVSNPLISSHAENNVNTNSFPAHSQSEHTDSSTKDNSSVMSEGKRVSFCNQVTVAQILLD